MSFMKATPCRPRGYCFCCCCCCAPRHLLPLALCFAMCWVFLALTVHVVVLALAAPYEEVSADLRQHDVDYLGSRASRCSLADPECFDLSRCKIATNASVSDTDLQQRIPVYIYGEREGLEGLLWTFRRLGGYARQMERARMMFAARVIDPIMGHPGLRVVRDPAEACLFVPLLSCLEVNRCEVWEGLAIWRLRALPYWNNGRNHVVFDNSDDLGAKFGADHAMRARTGFSRSYYRPFFDVAMPLHGRRIFWGTLRSRLEQPRPLLAVFRGSDTDPRGTRRALRALNLTTIDGGGGGGGSGGGDNGDSGDHSGDSSKIDNTGDVFIHVTPFMRGAMDATIAEAPLHRLREAAAARKVRAGGAGGRRNSALPGTAIASKRRAKRSGGSAHASSAAARRAAMLASPVSFGSLLLRSRFALVPRGNGLHSHRLVEAMSAGAIPVILADDYVLPFADLIDWPSCSFRFAEENVPAVVPFLRTVRPERVAKMRRAAMHAYETILHGGQRTAVAHTFSTLRRRLFIMASPAAGPAEIAAALRAETKAANAAAAPTDSILVLGWSSKKQRPRKVSTPPGAPPQLFMERGGK